LQDGIHNKKSISEEKAFYNSTNRFHFSAWPDAAPGFNNADRPVDLPPAIAYMKNTEWQQLKLPDNSVGRTPAVPILQA
jgi:hypothetical protein